MGPLGATREGSLPIFSKERADETCRPTASQPMSVPGERSLPGPQRRVSIRAACRSRRRSKSIVSWEKRMDPRGVL